MPAATTGGLAASLLRARAIDPGAQIPTDNTAACRMPRSPKQPKPGAVLNKVITQLQLVGSATADGDCLYHCLRELANVVPGLNFGGPAGHGDAPSQHVRRHLADYVRRMIEALVRPDRATAFAELEARLKQEATPDMSHDARRSRLQEMEAGLIEEKPEFKRRIQNDHGFEVVSNRQWIATLKELQTAIGGTEVWGDGNVLARASRM